MRHPRNRKIFGIALKPTPTYCALLSIANPLPVNNLAARLPEGSTGA